MIPCACEDASDEDEPEIIVSAKARRGRLLMHQSKCFGAFGLCATFVTYQLETSFNVTDLKREV